MKTKLLITLSILLFIFSCSSPENPSVVNKKSIAKYAGTYTGKAQYSVGNTQEDVIWIVKEDGTVTLNTKNPNREFKFENISETGSGEYNSQKKVEKSTLIINIIFKGNGNASMSFMIQDNASGTTETYNADKLVKN